MKAILEQEDVDLISNAVAEKIKPLLHVKEAEKDIIFSVDELAAYLRVSPKWVYDHSYELPHFKLGVFSRFRKKDIDKAIDRLLLKCNSNKTP